MPERRDNYKQSLFLSAVGTLLLAVMAAVLRLAGGPAGAAWAMRSFLPVAMAGHVVTFALGLLAARQTQISRAGGPWTPALLAAGAWAGALICLALYGLIQVFGSFMLGV